jgi:ATP adenylyltransferase
MTFTELKEFLESKMKLSHIYQPLLVKSLIDSGGSATVRQLASMFLTHDESQLPGPPASPVF